MIIRKRKQNALKGFTLAELLVVVAIIAVLVIIAVPVFQGSKEKAAEATDLANIRNAYGEVSVNAILTDSPAAITVSLQQMIDGWSSSSTAPSTLDQLGTRSGEPVANGTCKVYYDAESACVIFEFSNGTENTAKVYVPENPTYTDYANGFKEGIVDSLKRLQDSGILVLNQKANGDVQFGGIDSTTIDGQEIFIFGSNHVNGQRIIVDGKNYMWNDILMDTGLTQEQVQGIQERGGAPTRVYFDIDGNYLGYSYRDEHGNMNRDSVLNYADGTSVTVRFDSNIGSFDEPHLILNKEEALQLSN